MIFARPALRFFCDERAGEGKRREGRGERRRWEEKRERVEGRRRERERERERKEEERGGGCGRRREWGGRGREGTGRGQGREGEAQETGRPKCQEKEECWRLLDSRSRGARGLRRAALDSSGRKLGMWQVRGFRATSRFFFFSVRMLVGLFLNPQNGKIVSGSKRKLFYFYIFGP